MKIASPSVQLVQREQFQVAHRVAKGHFPSVSGWGDLERPEIRPAVWRNTKREIFVRSLCSALSNFLNLLITTE
ncbi:MAG: hypothetical protein ACI9FB_002333 [Candidatus Azotimanducaceae bacterium]|jgi:hypothetical protein